MISLEMKGLEKDLFEKMQQLINVIWASVPVAILFVISIGIKTETYMSIDALIRPMIFIVVASIFLSVFFGILVKTKKHLELQVYLTHLSFVFICMVGIHYSGGIESPLYVLILVFFLFSSVIIPSNMSVALSTVCSALYVLLIFSEYHNFISHINFVHTPAGNPIQMRGFDQGFLVIVRVSLFYLVAIVPGYLASVLREKNIKLELINSQLKEAQNQIVQTEKLASIGQLLSGVTHEIKNPLTSVYGFAELCQARVANNEKEIDREEMDEFLGKITSSAKHCVSVVQGLLDFARNPSEAKDNFTAVDINESTEGVLKMIEHQIYLQNIKIVRSIKPDLPPVFGNDNQLRQVFLNIVVNAKDAMPNGGRITIISGLKPDDPNFVELKFIDTGTGILQEKLDKIFDPFFTTKEKGKGTGLGLSVSYGIIKNHNGNIEVQSSQDKGTMFTITLPIINNDQKTRRVLETHTTRQNR